MTDNNTKKSEGCCGDKNQAANSSCCDSTKTAEAKKDIKSGSCCSK